MTSFSMLKKALFFSCLAFLSSGYKVFLISSTPLGKSSATPYCLTFGMFLICDLINSLSLKKDTFAIMGLGCVFFLVLCPNFLHITVISQRPLVHKAGRIHQKLS